MRVIVCGSRSWMDPEPIERALAELPAGTLVIEGGAQGADTLAYRAAQFRGLAVQTFLARWDLYGLGAGPIRNSAMLKEGVDLVLAFRKRGSSPGTDDLVRKAIRAGIEVRIVEAD